MDVGLHVGRRAATALIVGAMFAFAAGAAMANSTTVTGAVIYRERMMLPEGAVARIRLEDVSLADAPARVLAETTVPARTSPTAFTLAYDPAELEAGHTYAWRATISVGDVLLFTTTERHALDPQADRVELLVRRVADGEATALPLTGAWLAEDIDGGGVIDNLQTTLEIAADGKVSGSGGCNRFSGSAKVDGDTVTFGDLASTMMACTEAAMNQEHKFHAALAAARTFRIDAGQKKLFLSDAAGKVVLQFTAM
ncbi:META domain-containing protein [Devosia sp. ZB163]|uniref:META domain-containing protein n=1 Tax=Devosia sp. ZB163 TaxID=3025938 RepID=UPI002361359E|nr:META domain-containing protein [Devosia sp. ZB163]MDC9824489.1 META domain-containing protein [Devosia sp. ZB163]